MAGRNDSGPARALRLTIVQDGNELKVASSHSVNMVVPPTDQTYGFADHAGFWFEVRSDRQECLYRRVMPNPLGDEVEALSGDPERPFTRVKLPGTQKVFVLLVPEIDAGRELVLCTSPIRAPGARAQPIAALDLRKPTGKLRILAKFADTSGDSKPPSKGKGTKTRSPKRRK